MLFLKYPLTLEHEGNIYRTQKKKDPSSYFPRVLIFLCHSQKLEQGVVWELMGNRFSIHRKKDFGLDRFSKFMSLQYLTTLVIGRDRDTRSAQKQHRHLLMRYQLFFVRRKYTSGLDRQHRYKVDHHKRQATVH